jgi:SAM-dependent methyltransferase
MTNELKLTFLTEGDMKLNIETILRLQEKPEPFTPGEALFWDDPHISTQMLKAHLDTDSDLASRRLETIQKSADWLIATLDLQRGDCVLDLGCGPGLYAARLAEKGLHVTGIDYSRRPIEYAQEYGRLHKLDVHYRYQDYLMLDEEDQYDAALLIYGDFCPLSPEQRRQLLGNVRRALKPGGHFVFDVTTPTHRRQHGSKNGWYAVETGFWKSGRHLVLEDGFDFPEQSIFLDQAIVIEESGKVSVYRNWFQDFTRETISKELTEAGFVVQTVWNDLTGTPYAEDSAWIGLVVRKN